MSIRSIDLQVLIPRSTEVSKSQQLAEHQNIAQQQQVAEQMQQLSNKRQHQVQRTDKSSGGKVEERKERRQGQRDQEKKEDSHSRQASAQDNGSEQTDPLRGRLIDIKT